MFGSMLPSVASSMATTTPPAMGSRDKRKPMQQGRKPKGRGKGLQKGSGPAREEDQEQTMKDMLRMILRHDQAISRISMDAAILFTFMNKSNHQENILPALYRVSQAWRAKMDTETKPSLSLRVTVLHCLMAELEARVQAVMAEPQRIDTCKKQGWMTLGGLWTTPMWQPSTENPSPRRQVWHLSRQPPGDNQRGQGSFAPRGRRFQANRPLAEEMTGHQITFTALRSPGPLQLYDSILKLAGVSALQLIALRLHRPRLQPSALAATLQEAWRKYGPSDCKIPIICAMPTQ